VSWPGWTRAMPLSMAKSRMSQLLLQVELNFRALMRDEEGTFVRVQYKGSVQYLLRTAQYDNQRENLSDAFEQQNPPMVINQSIITDIN
jgi:predicted nucleotidyltransferase